MPTQFIFCLIMLHIGAILLLSV